MKVGVSHNSWDCCVRANTVKLMYTFRITTALMFAAPPIYSKWACLLKLLYKSKHGMAVSHHVSIGITTVQMFCQFHRLFLFLLEGGGCSEGVWSLTGCPSDDVDAKHPLACWNFVL